MSTPSPLTNTLLDRLRAELRHCPPFAQLLPATLDSLVGGARQTYYAPGETVLDPGAGPLPRLLWIRRGAVAGRAADGLPFESAAGDLLPIGAVLGERAVSAPYTAVDDVFCLEFDAALFRRLVAADTVLADFANRRVQHLLEASRRALQTTLAGRVLDEQSFESPLALLPRRLPVAASPDTTVHAALSQMHAARVGSILAIDADGALLGILTEADLLGRILLAEPPPDLRRVRLGALMTQPVHSLDIGARLHDAALLMARHGIHHLPLTQRGQVVSVIAEHDLFALQLRSLKSLSADLGDAPDVPALVGLAPSIRQFARDLLARGLIAPALTGLVSHLNDVLTRRLVQIIAAQRGLSMRRACWLAFGSEARAEQTVATDQDNGLVLADEVDETERQAWLLLAGEVNLRLDECGYPLCKGGVMAGNPACCLRLRDWRARFADWMARATPEDLLKASIYFDLRPLAGESALAAPLSEMLVGDAARQPRFLHLLAQNVMRSSPALNWHGGLQADADAEDEAAPPGIDLKLRGSALFVESARLLALASGVAATGTRERLAAAGNLLGVPAAEHESWVGAFDLIQALRLRVQIGGVGVGGGATNPNRVDPATLSDLDRRLLKDALGVARRLQQRIALDWLR